MEYFEEEEQYMHDMNNAQIQKEYDRLAAEHEEQKLSEEDRINSCKNEEENIQ